ncbi:hypothetical protein H671_8g19412 [Cricetulus griseus]|uniref:Uncharacterized protein n=1 Tax=Cricetulus griseus TaxID=10029 RepID=A0A061I025_CRIGR|nr:hypothetical protein H671_8g19412 [Cricetulus griseus]
MTVVVPLSSAVHCCEEKLQARTSSTILKRYGESGLPYLAPDFRGMKLNFSPFSLMLAVGLLYIVFIMFSVLLSIFVSMFMRDIGL